jgi:hypothetical protein
MMTGPSVTGQQSKTRTHYPGPQGPMSLPRFQRVSPTMLSGDWWLLATHLSPGSQFEPGDTCKVFMPSFIVDRFLILCCDFFLFFLRCRCWLK